MDFIKKKMRLEYKQYPEYPPHELKVICKEKWGDETVAKCKVLKSKDWYNEIYITIHDLYTGRVRVI